MRYIFYIFFLSLDCIHVTLLLVQLFLLIPLRGEGREGRRKGESRGDNANIQGIFFLSLQVH